MKMTRPSDAVVVGAGLQVGRVGNGDSSRKTVCTRSDEIYRTGDGSSAGGIVSKQGGSKRSRLSRSSITVCDHGSNKFATKEYTISKQADSKSVHGDTNQVAFSVSCRSKCDISEPMEQDTSKLIEETVPLYASDFAEDPFLCPNATTGSSDPVERSKDSTANLGIHVIAVLESTETYREPFDVREMCRGSFYPLVVTLCTSPLRIARSTEEPICPSLVPGARRATADRGPYTLWEIPVSPERTFDFATNSKCFVETARGPRREIVRELVRLIIEYKVVYLRNVPQRYHGILQDVWTRWSSAIASLTGVRSSVQRLGNSERDSVGSGCGGSSTAHR